MIIRRYKHTKQALAELNRIFENYSNASEAEIIALREASGAQQKIIDAQREIVKADTRIISELREKIKQKDAEIAELKTTHLEQIQQRNNLVVELQAALEAARHREEEAAWRMH